VKPINDFGPSPQTYCPFFGKGSVVERAWQPTPPDFQRSSAPRRAVAATSSSSTLLHGIAPSTADAEG
jgi:hypothetical protein